MPTLAFIVLIGGIPVALAFGPRRHGRVTSRGERVIGVVLLTHFGIVALAVFGREHLAGEVPCVFGQCTGAPRRPAPATAGTTLDGHWIGGHGRTLYGLDLLHNAAQIEGTGVRGGNGSEGGSAITVRGSTTSSGVELDLGGTIYVGGLVDALTLRGRLGAAGGGEDLVLKKRGPRQDRAKPSVSRHLIPNR